MGSGQSSERRSITVEEVEKDAFEVVHLSENVLRQFGGTKVQYFSTPTTVESRSVSNQTPSETDENLRSALLEQETIAKRLRQDLGQSDKEASHLRSEINRLENVLKDQNQTRNASVNFNDDKNIQVENLYYREKLKELKKNQSQFQEQQAKEFRENVAKLEKRFLDSTCSIVCTEEELKLMQCYLKNRKKSLECEKLAENFVKCVDDFRTRMKIPKESYPQ